MRAHRRARTAHASRPDRQVNGRPTATPIRTPTSPRPLDRVVIRFAGDSGDGMQLVGDRFTDVSAAFGNDLATLPNYPAEIRAPAGTIAGRLVLPGPHLRPRHPHAGRRARRARGDEPGRAEGEPARGAARLDPPRQRRHVRGAQPRQGRLLGEPARGRLARRLPGDPGAHDLDHARGDQGARREAARRRALEELLRPRPRVVDVHAPGRAGRRVDREALRRQRPMVRDANLAAFKAGLPLRRDRRALRPRLRGPHRPICRPAATATSPATSRWRTA